MKKSRQKYTGSVCTAKVEKAYRDLYGRLDTKKGDWLDRETKLFQGLKCTNK